MVAHAASDRRQRGQQPDEHERQHDAVGRRQQHSWNGSNGNVANAKGIYAQGQSYRQREGKPGRSSWWATESDVGGMVDGLSQGLDGGRMKFWEPEWADVPRVASGVPNRVKRLKALGNAVVPAVAEWIGRRILEVDRG